MAPVVLYRAIGDQLPHDLAEGAVLWALAQLAVQRDATAIQRAGIAGEGAELGEALFDAILAGESGIVFAADEWDASFGRIGVEGGRLELAIPELFEELQGLATEGPAELG